jgi:hypothetical protein
MVSTLALIGWTSVAVAGEYTSSLRPSAPHTADISDLFVWTLEPGRLGLALMAQPYSGKRTRFDPDVTRRFILRRATITGTGADVRIQTADEVRIECVAQPAPHRDDDRMRCQASGALGTHTIEAAVGDEVTPIDADGMRLFAGPRRDPFYINVGVVHVQRARDGDRTPPRGPDIITPGWARAKVMAVVLEIDVAHLFGDARGLFSVAAETDVDGVQEDRIGRPEITGFVLKQKWGAEIPGTDVRDAWNADATFAMSPGHIRSFRDAMVAGLARLDDLDRFDDPRAAAEPNAGPGLSPDWARPHPMADLLLGDALLVDPSRPCTANQDTYFEIEMASFRGLPPDATGARHQTCGGRTLNADVIDETLALFINGPDRVPPGPPLYGPPGAYAPRRGDGIDRPRTPGTDVFPYLHRP